MNRREAVLAIAGVSALFIAACDNEQKPEPTATLLNNKNVHEAMKELVEAIEALEGDVDEFATMNWRQVVPQVEESTGAVREAVDRLRQELGYSD
jgi:hypothetical protein